MREKGKRQLNRILSGVIPCNSILPQRRKQHGRIKKREKCSPEKILGISYQSLGIIRYVPGGILPARKFDPAQVFILEAQTWEKEFPGAVCPDRH